MSTQTNAQEKRQPTIVRLLPSLRVKIDKRRADSRESLSDWIEAAVRAALTRKPT